MNDPAVENANLYSLLYDANRDRLQQTALQLASGESIRYETLFARSECMSAALLQLNAKPGDRVAVQVDKSAAAVCLYLACLHSGLVMVPLNTAYTSQELEYFFTDAKPSVVVCNERDLSQLQTLAASSISLIALRGADSLEAKSETTQAGARPQHCQADDLAAIVYTSGTTGRSKGAMLSHGNLSSNATSLRQLWGFCTDDVLLHALPIFHVHGLFVALNTALLNGSRIIFLEKFDTDSVLAQLPQSTVMMGVPTFYTRLLASESFNHLHYAHMRLFISGSAPLTEQTFEQFEQRTGQRILERYGMSETGMISSNPLQGERKAGTVGFALPDVEIRICDGSGNELDTGETGLIEVRGPNVFQGYWQMPEKTAQEFREGNWFITGDLGCCDSQGRLSIVGREKDLIISGGYNVYPKEVELRLDAIEGIAESAVIGVPHSDFGEAVVAICVCNSEAAPDVDAVITQLEHQLANYKRPKRVIFIDALPRNTMGKVQKNILRESYNNLFTEKEAP